MSSFYTYADMHCDSLLRVIENGSEAIVGGEGMQSFEHQAAAKQMLQFYAIFFPSPESYKEWMPGWRKGPINDDEFYEKLKDALVKETNRHSDKIRMAYSSDDVIRNESEGIMSAMLTIEDGRFVNGDMKKLEKLHRDGVRAIALTWNFANCFGFPNSNDKEIMQKGLTDFGKEAVEEMNRLGILVDVSHLSDGGFYDVARITKKPFIASHSNCRELTNHSRNLTDDMIRILAENGGVAGLNFCPAFTGPDKQTVDNLADHVMHMFKTGGEEFPALGTDFDGISGDMEIEHPEQMQKLFNELERRGLSSSQIEKFAYKNVMRVLRDSVG